MWISKQHFQLIKDTASEFRRYHEEVVHAQQFRIDALEARTLLLETERSDLTHKMLGMLEVVRPPVYNPVEIPPVTTSDWEDIMRAQIKEINDAQP